MPELIPPAIDRASLRAASTTALGAARRRAAHLLLDADRLTIPGSRRHRRRGSRDLCLGAPAVDEAHDLPFVELAPEVIENPQVPSGLRNCQKVQPFIGGMSRAGEDPTTDFRAIPPARERVVCAPAEDDPARLLELALIAGRPARRLLTVAIMAKYRSLQVS